MPQTTTHLPLDIDTVLAELTHWERDAERPGIRRQFRFADFSAAFAFMARVALLAEKIDHHPEWSNVYNRVDVLLTTHDTGGVSDRDLTMAHFMDQIAVETS